MLDQQAIVNALRTVMDPELHKDLVTLNMVKDIQISNGNVSLTVTLTTPACPLKETLRKMYVTPWRSLGECVRWR